MEGSQEETKAELKELMTRLATAREEAGGKYSVHEF